MMVEDEIRTLLHDAAGSRSDGPDLVAVAAGVRRRRAITRTSAALVAAALVVGGVVVIPGLTGQRVEFDPGASPTDPVSTPARVAGSEADGFSWEMLLGRDEGGPYIRMHTNEGARTGLQGELRDDAAFGSASMVQGQDHAVLYGVVDPRVVEVRAILYGGADQSLEIVRTDEVAFYSGLFDNTARLRRLVAIGPSGNEAQRISCPLGQSLLGETGCSASAVNW